MYGPPRAIPGRRGRHRLVLVPGLGPLTVRRRFRERSLVESRLRVRDRHQPDREPVHRLREGARPAHAALRRQVAAEEGHGDAGGRARVPLHRLGVGWRLVERDEGLHALLDQRPLSPRPVGRVGLRGPARRNRVRSLESRPVVARRREDVEDDGALRTGVHLVRTCRAGCATSLQARARAPRRRHGTTRSRSRPSRAARSGADAPVRRCSDRARRRRTSIARRRPCARARRPRCRSGPSRARSSNADIRTSLSRRGDP